MTHWRNILLFCCLTFICIGYVLHVPDTIPEVFISHFPSLVFFGFVLSQKQNRFIKAILLFAMMLYCFLCLLIVLQRNLFTPHVLHQLHRINSFIFYLGFTLLFRRLGSGIYTENRKGLYRGLPVGLFVFLGLLWLYFGKMESRIEPIFLIFSGFLAYFFILGINTPLNPNKYRMLILGLAINLVSIVLNIRFEHVVAFSGGHFWISTTFMTSVFMIYYACIDHVIPIELKS